MDDRKLEYLERTINPTEDNEKLNIDIDCLRKELEASRTALAAEETKRRQLEKENKDCESKVNELQILNTKSSLDIEAQKNLSVEYMKKISTLEEKCAELERKTSVQESSIQSYLQSIRDHEDTIRGKEEKLLSLESSVEILNATIRQQGDTIQSQKDEIGELEELKRLLEGKIRSQVETIKALEAAGEEQTKSFQDLRDRDLELQENIRNDLNEKHKAFVDSETEKHKDEVTKLKLQVENVMKENLQLLSELEVMKEQIKRNEDSALVAERVHGDSLTALETRVTELLKQKEGLQDQSKLVNGENLDLKNRVSNQLEEIKALDAKVLESQRKVESLEATVSELEQTVSELEYAKEELVASAGDGGGASEAEVQEWKDQIAALEKQLAQLTDKYQETDSERVELLDESGRLKQEIGALSALLAEKETGLKESVEEGNRVQTELGDVKALLVGRMEEVERLERRSELLQSALARAEEEQSKREKEREKEREERRALEAAVQRADAKVQELEGQLKAMQSSGGEGGDSVAEAESDKRSKSRITQLMVEKDKIAEEVVKLQRQLNDTRDHLQQRALQHSNEVTELTRERMRLLSEQKAVWSEERSALLEKIEEQRRLAIDALSESQDLRTRFMRSEEVREALEQEKFFYVLKAQDLQVRND